MTTEKSKAERILELLAKGLQPKAIADEVGCLTAYVRVVRQRAQSPDGMTPSQRTYEAKNTDKIRERERRYKRRRYETDPVYRERARLISKRWREAQKIKARIRRLGDSIREAADAAA